MLHATSGYALPSTSALPSSHPRPPSAPLSDSLLLTLRRRPHTRLFRALFQYLPLRDSPNENPSLELALNPGDMILVKGEMDDDGFYRGETMDGRSGLVPSNYVERVPDFWLLQNSTRAPSPSFPLSIPTHHTAIAHDFSDQSRDIPTSIGGAADLLNDYRSHEAYASGMPDSVCPYPSIDVSCVTVQEIKSDTPRVPCPREIAIEKKLSRSLVVAWSPPEESFVAISQYHVCIDGQVRAVVPGSYKCRALIEDVCLDGSVNVSVRAVTEQGHSPDAACSIAVGTEAAVAPQHLRVWAVTPITGCVRWYPSNSNAEHVISLNAIKVGVCPPSVYQVQLGGLSPSTIYRVSVRTKHPKAVLEQRPVERCLDFKTLPKIGLPDPPLNVCCEAGPQPGTLLVSWSPIQTQPKPPSRAAVQAYLIYADGKNIAQVPSGTADHVLLRLADLSDDPPIFITVRTKTREGAVSGDSNVARVPRVNQLTALAPSFVDPLRGPLPQNDLLKLQDPLEVAQMAASYPSSSFPSMQHQSSLPSQLPGYTHLGTLTRQQAVAPCSAPVSLQASMVGGQGALTSLPALSFAQSQMPHFQPFNPYSTGYLQGYPQSIASHGRVLPAAANAEGISPRQWKAATMSQYYTFHPRLMRGEGMQDDIRPSVMEMESNYLLRHRQGDWMNGGDPRMRGTVAYPNRQMSAEARTHRLIPPRLARVKSESGFGTRSEPDLRPMLDEDCRWFVALFDYDHHMSPNANAENEELSFRKHQLIKVYGDVDLDGFYTGQIGGRTGLVPSNMVIEIAKDDFLPRRSSPAREAIPSGAEPALRRMRWGSLKSRSYDHAGDRRTIGGYGRPDASQHYSSLDRRDHSLPSRDRYRRSSARVDYGRYEGRYRDRDDWKERDRDREEKYREENDRDEPRDSKYRSREYYDRREERYAEERKRHPDGSTHHNGYQEPSDHRREDPHHPSSDDRGGFYGNEPGTSGYPMPSMFQQQAPQQQQTQIPQQPPQQMGLGMGMGMGMQQPLSSMSGMMGQQSTNTMTQMGMGGMANTQLPSQMTATHPPPLISQGSTSQLIQPMQQMGLGNMNSGGAELATNPSFDPNRLNGLAMRKMIAKFDYDSRQLSPNVDAEQVELSFRQGDVLTVYGEMDEDGFYMGELNGQRGLVPSNFLQSSPLTSLAPSQPSDFMAAKKGVAFSDAAAVVAMAKKSLPNRASNPGAAPSATVSAGKPVQKKSTSAAPAGSKPLAKKSSDVSGGKGGAPARKTSSAVKKDPPKKK